MASTSRRRVVAGGIAAATTLNWPARAAEFSYKWATDIPSSYAIVQQMIAAADAVREETDGRLDIRMLPGGQLGTSQEMLNQVRSGAVEFTFLSTGVLSTVVPVMSVSNLGFAFPDYERLWAALDGDLGAYLRAQMTKVGNIFMFDRLLDAGYRDITTSTRPVNVPEDLRGLKIRTPPNPMATTLLSALGAAPTPLPYPDIYPALASKLVDGQENPLNIIEGGKFYEVQKYCTMSRHMWEGFAAVGNMRAWNRLPENIRQIAKKHIEGRVDAQRAAVVTQEATLRSVLAAKGLTFIDPPSVAFRAGLESTGYYAAWKAKFGPDVWTILERYTGPLG